MNTNWIQNADCRGLDPNLFVPERYDHTAIRDAKKICATCPVQTECRNYGLELHRHFDLDGIFGGLTKIERLRLLRKEALPRRRQSPLRDNKFPVKTRQRSTQKNIRFRPENMKPCGTTAAYARHLRHKEPPCEACRQAHALWQWNYRKTHGKPSRRQVA